MVAFFRKKYFNIPLGVLVVLVFVLLNIFASVPPETSVELIFGVPINGRVFVILNILLQRVLPALVAGTLLLKKLPLAQLFFWIYLGFELVGLGLSFGKVFDATNVEKLHPTPALRNFFYLFFAGLFLFFLFKVWLIRINRDFFGGETKR